MSEIPSRVGNKEEAEKYRQDLGDIVIPDECMKMMIYVDRKQGKVFAQPFVGRKLSPEEKAKREAQAKAKSEAYWNKVQAKKQEKIAKAKARLEKAQARLKELSE